MIRKNLQSFDKKILSVLDFSEVSEPRGIICIIHSKAEHSERYDDFANYLNGRGYVVYALDLRGHGETDSQMRGYGFGDVFTDSLKDLAFVSKFYSEKFPKLKQGIIGHGYGSFLALGFAERFSRYVDALILGGNYTRDYLFVNRLICELSLKFRGENYKSRIVNSFSNYNVPYGDSSFLSSSQAYVSGYALDPKTGFDLSNGYYKSFYKGVHEIFKKNSLERLSSDLPIAIFDGEKDSLGKQNSAQKQLKKIFEEMGIKKVMVKTYVGAKHDYFSDVSREEARSDIAGFFDTNL